jgi:apolipoprotein N-acyltransferase
VVLVPGGEYTPFGDVLPPLRAFKEYLSPIPELTAGSREVAPFLVDTQPPADRRRGDVKNREVSAGTANCFEIAFPAFCRTWRERGATVLVNAANYGWFGDSGMPAQILAIGRLRAAELAVTVVMAGNTGPTAILDPAGRVRSQVSGGPGGAKTQYVEGWCAGPLWSDARATAYAAWGDVPWFLASGLVLLWCLRPRPRRPDALPAEAAPAPPGPSAGLPPGVGATDPPGPR